MKLEIASLSKHQSLFYSSKDKHILTVWRDSKILYLLSNNGSNSISETQRKNSTETQGLMVPCPDNTIHYSQLSRGVDLLDQMREDENVERRSRKLYKPIVLHLLQISLYNSFLLFRKKNSEKN